MLLWFHILFADTLQPDDTGNMAEYCDTPQSKERRNREYKVCLNERAILRLLDQEFLKNSNILRLRKRVFFDIVSYLNASVKTHGEILSYNWIKIFVGGQTHMKDLVFLELFSIGK